MRSASTICTSFPHGYSRRANCIPIVEPPLRGSPYTRSSRAGRLSAVDVVEQHLAAIAAREPEIHAFNHVMDDAARERAAAIDAAVAAGDDPGPLAGVPVALKDNMCTRGVPTTCSSRILEGWKPPYDATIVTRLQAAGAIIIGKTNLDEFAMGSSNMTSHFGGVENPWKRRGDNRKLVPGGSSGGSAAAVAAYMVPGSTGTDTGGSIRQPAALCGVVGLKPSYGRVSRYGLVAYASSLDQVGPFAHTVADAALLLQAIAGHDHRKAARPPSRTACWRPGRRSTITTRRQCRGSTARCAAAPTTSVAWTCWRTSSGRRRPRSPRAG